MGAWGLCAGSRCRQRAARGRVCEQRQRGKLRVGYVGWPCASQTAPLPPTGRTMVIDLRATKHQQQAQIKGMERAELQLTEHLRATHQQIDEQLSQLREQLKVGGRGAVGTGAVAGHVPRARIG